MSQIYEPGQWIAPPPDSPPKHPSLPIQAIPLSPPASITPLSPCPPLHHDLPSQLPALIPQVYRPVDAYHELVVSRDSWRLYAINLYHWGMQLQTYMNTSSIVDWLLAASQRDQDCIAAWRQRSQEQEGELKIARASLAASEERERLLR